MTRSPLTTDVARFILGTLGRVIDAQGEGEFTLDTGIVRHLCDLGAEGIDSRQIIATLTRELAKERDAAAHQRVHVVAIATLARGMAKDIDAAALAVTVIPGLNDVRTFKTLSDAMDSEKDGRNG